eukprot:Sspe_Gene.60693::Locus_33506_Transcript_1_1_Confidence_1.000_Length_960::g.60693::m.60693
MMGKRERDDYHGLPWKSALRVVRGELSAGRLAATLDARLVDEAVAITKDWVDLARDGNPGMAGFVGHTKFFEEMEEALVPASRLLDWFAGGSEGGVVMDMGCGKGFTGMLVGCLAKRKGWRVREVLLVDYEVKGEMKSSHFDEIVSSGLS